MTAEAVDEARRCVMIALAQGDKASGEIRATVANALLYQLPVVLSEAEKATLFNWGTTPAPTILIRPVLLDVLIQLHELIDAT